MRKRILRTLTALLLTLSVVFCTLPVQAAGGTPTVIFDAATGKFSFENAPVYPGNAYPDLFQNFKNLMPGDERSQQIEVKVIHAGNDTVKLYLRAELRDGERYDNYARLFDADKIASDGSPLAQLSVTFDRLSASPKKLTRRLAEAVGLRTAEMVTYTEAVGEPLYLGAYTGDSRSRNAEVRLAFDIEAGNEYQGLTAQVDWVFIAEVYSEPHTPGGSGLAFDKELHQLYLIGYPDGTVRPDGNITRAETAAVFFRLLTEQSRQKYWCTTNSYSDVSASAWYNNEISTLTAAGIVEGYPDGSFRPNNPITRAEFVAMFMRVEGEEAAGQLQFPDISGHWAEKSICGAASRKLVIGYPDGTFRPDRYITRAEVATIMNRVLGRRPHIDGFLPDMIRWPDNADESAWYYEAIQEATNSHTYAFWQDKQNLMWEDWLALTENIDWTKYEQYMESGSTYRSLLP